MKRTKQDRAVLIAIGVLAVVQMALFVIPILWVLIQSINTYYQYIVNPFGLPKRLVFGNYLEALKNLNINVYTGGKLINYNAVNMTMFSFIIALAEPLVAVIINMTFAYVLTKYSHWRYCQIISAVNIIVMILPIYGALPAALRLYKALGLYDNLLFLLFGHTGMGMTLILYGGAYKGMPTAYKEAATIDGAGHFLIMLKIYMPLILPLASAQFIMAFLGKWNDYNTNVVYLPSYPNLSYGAFMYQTNATGLGASMPELLAGMVILAIPSFIIWGFSQKLVSQKMSIGGLKG